MAIRTTRIVLSIHISLILGVLLELASLALGLPVASTLPPQSVTSAQQQQQAQAPIELAARFQDAYVLFEELDELVLARFSESKLGRETRLFMLKLRAVDSIGRELGVAASPEEVQKMLKSIESDIKTSGAASGLDEYLVQQGVSREEFLESLRLAVLQTKLSRRGLGIPPDQPITAEQQEMWLTDQITQRGLEEFPAPWDDGIVLRNADVEIRRDEFIPFLRKRMDPADVLDCLHEILRVKRMRARMPDVDPETLREAIDAEIENRRVEVQSDAKYKGISYEQLLSSQGIIFSKWRDDPNVEQSALARLWVRRSYDEEGLRGVYESERDFYDGEFGEALEASVLFLRAAQFPNELIPLDYAAAEAKIVEIAGGVKSSVEFQAAVELHSDDSASRKRKGYLGWVTRSGATGPSPARSAIFAALDQGDYKPTDPADSTTRLVGPVRTSAGVLLLWIGQRRPKPSWNEMIVYVHRTLRQKFIDEAIDVDQVITYLDD